MRWAILGAVAAFGAAVGAQALAAPARPSAVTQPDWVAKPNADDLGAHFPKAAVELGIPGRATVDCEVDAFGALRACQVASESPAQLGFGPAAVAMTPLFRMRPMTRDGHPVAGARVRIPVNFALPPDPPAPKMGPTDPQTLALARRFVVQLLPQAGIVDAIKAKADEIEFIADDGTPQDTRSAAAKALRTAAEADAPRFIDDNAAAVAAILTAPELQEIVGFAESPAGRTMRPDPDVHAVLEMLQRDFVRRSQAAAGAAFCQTHACAVQPVLTAPANATIVAPTWVRAPDDDQIDAARPAILGALGLGGAARLVCKIDVLATPVDCSVAAEAPAGLGVGSAAISLAGGLRLSPLLMSQGAQSETVAFNVIFAAPDPEDAFKPPHPRSARAAALAHELASLGAAPALSAQDEANLRAFMDRRAPDADQAVVAAAITAIRKAEQDSFADYRAGVEAMDAALFSEDELAGAIAFHRSAGAKALFQKQARIGAATAAAAERDNAQLVQDARTLFCKDHPCELESH